MSRDDNIEDLFADEPTPAPDAPPDPEEMAQAAAFAGLIDSVVGDASDGALPPVMDPDQRALAEVAGIVKASTRDIELGAERRSQLIDQALGQALASIHGDVVDLVGRVEQERDDAAEPDDDRGSAGDRRAVSDLASFRRKRLATIVPWAVAGLAAAAALILLLNRPTDPISGPEVVEAKNLPAELQSRPSDELIGEIPRDRVEYARERTDRIYADRMAGYRSLRFGGRR